VAIPDSLLIPALGLYASLLGFCLTGRQAWFWETHLGHSRSRRQSQCDHVCADRAMPCSREQVLGEMVHLRGILEGKGRLMQRSLRFLNRSQVLGVTTSIQRKVVPYCLLLLLFLGLGTAYTLMLVFCNPIRRTSSPALESSCASPHLLYVVGYSLLGTNTYYRDGLC
jgi:hypothetical protein